MVRKVGILLGLTLTLSIISTAFAKDNHLSRGGLNEDEEEAVNKAYERTRGLLGPEELSFLEQILAADELIMQRQQRGIVDQILAAISGVPSSSNLVGVGPVIGGNTVQQQGQPLAVAVSPAAAATAPLPASTPNANANANAPNTAQQPMNGANNHLYQQVSKVVSNSFTGNVTGIVDEALKIGTPAPIRDLVNGILGVAYCNGIRRLLGRC